MKYLQTYNESIRDYLKPKSEQDIIKSINNLHMGKRKIRYIIEYDMINSIDIEEFKKNFFYLDTEEWVEYLSLPRVRNIFTNNEISSIKNSLTDLYYELYDYHSRNYWIEELKNTELFTDDEIERFKNYKQNESIKNVLKPKSKDKIDDIANKLSPTDKILKGCEYGVLWLVKQGIEEGGDPTISHNAPIILAIDNEHIDIIKYLLTIPEVDPSDRYNNAIWYAADDNKNFEIVKLLLLNNKVRTKLIETDDLDYFTDIIKDHEWVINIFNKVRNSSSRK